MSSEFRSDFIQIKKTITTTKVIEMYVWGVIAAIVSGRVWFAYWSNGGGFYVHQLQELYFDILAGIGVLIFPILFYLVFSSLPFEAIRNRKRKLEYIRQLQVLADEEIAEDAEPNVSVDLDHKMQHPELDSTAKIHSTVLLRHLTDSSKLLSEKIYNRSGVYLLIGVLIALLGVGFFYTQTATYLKDIRDINLLVLLLLPRFGVLFFIELIAFFFLKQYRSSMEEFRYYEEVKRNREDNLAILLLASEEKVLFKDVIDKCSFHKKVGLLEKGSTTEHIETKKLEKDELELLDKILGIINKSKK